VNKNGLGGSVWVPNKIHEKGFKSFVEKTKTKLSILVITTS